MDIFFINLQTLIFAFLPEIWLIIGFFAISFFYIWHKENKVITQTQTTWVFYSALLFILFFYTYLSLQQILFARELIQSFTVNSLFWIDQWVFLLKAIFGYLVFCITYAYVTGFQINEWRVTSDSNVFEFVILLLLMLLGMSFCLMANNLIAFYLALELQSFCLFILLFLGTNTKETTRASIVYFLSVLISSIFFLVGVSYLYWRFGVLNLNDLWLCFHVTKSSSSFTLADLIFSHILLLGLFIKVGLFPVHLWVPEVYAFGKIFPVSLIATVSKLFGFAIILQFYIVFSPQLGWFSLIGFAAIGAIIHGVLSGLTQFSILSLLGYSAIAHMGYIFLAVSLNTSDAYAYAFFYLCIYLLNLFPIFLLILTARLKESGKLSSTRRFSSVSDFKYLVRNEYSSIFVFLLFSTFFFSFIGIPPFSGFFAKFYIIKCLFYSDHFFAAFIMGFFSVVSGFYYLKIIKAMFFEPKEENSKEDKTEDSFWVIPKNILFIIVCVGLLNLCFIFFSSFFLNFIFSFFILKLLL